MIRHHDPAYDPVNWGALFRRLGYILAIGIAAGIGRALSVIIWG